MAKSASKTEKSGTKKTKKKRKKKAVVSEEVAAEQAANNETEAVAEEKAPSKEEKKKKSESESTHAKYERIKRGKLYLTDLQKMSVSELHEEAKKENIQEYTALKKQNLIFRILKERIRQNGLLYGEGVLEVLPDNYGFLRNPRYNYLSSPDDIYVSPSQIRRFGLRTGNVVSGQIRPPK
ncbi:MAG: Rho termination factor N-terminal domain-containing protein, partial [Planctomycetota bacterium]